MSSDLEVRLREVLADASEPVRPPAGLAEKVRISARRRRRVAVSAATAVAAVFAVAIAVASPAIERGGDRLVSPDYGPSPFHLALADGLAGMAIGGDVLYLATGDAPDAVLSAYNRMTGRLIGSVRVPALVRSLTVGPGGNVWMTFVPDQNGGRAGLWLLSADLRHRSSASATIVAGIGLSGLLPTGATTALAGMKGGLGALVMPVPGQRGSASLHQMLAVRTDHGYSSDQYAQLGNRIAVLQENQAQRERITIVGTPGSFYEPDGLDITAVAPEADGLWVATAPSATGPLTGGVARLGPDLQVLTPRAIATDRDLQFPAGLWTDGDTVWVTTQSLTRSLFCFRYQPKAGTGPVMFVATRDPPSFVAAAGGTVYVADALGLTTYRVPAACR